MPGERQLSIDWGQPGSILAENNEMFWVRESQAKVCKVRWAIAREYLFFFKEKKIPEY